MSTDNEQVAASARRLYERYWRDSLSRVKPWEQVNEATRDFWLDMARVALV